MQALARDYQLAGEFSKSLTSNLQTRIPAKIEEFKNRGIITRIGKVADIEAFKTKYGAQDSDALVADKWSDVSAFKLSLNPVNTKGALISR